MIKVYCPKCGTQFDMDENKEFMFCAYCGTKINNGAKADEATVLADESLIKRAEAVRANRPEPPRAPETPSVPAPTKIHDTPKASAVPNAPAGIPEPKIDHAPRREPPRKDNPAPANNQFKPNLFINYSTINMAVTMIVRIVATGVKNQYMNGQGFAYRLAPGWNDLVLKIGKKNYARKVYINENNDPVTIYASWNGRAHISINQPPVPNMSYAPINRTPAATPVNRPPVAPPPAAPPVAPPQVNNAPVNQAPVRQEPAKRLPVEKAQVKQESSGRPSVRQVKLNQEPVKSAPVKSTPEKPKPEKRKRVNRSAVTQEPVRNLRYKEQPQVEEVPSWNDGGSVMPVEPQPAEEKNLLSLIGFICALSIVGCIPGLIMCLADLLKGDESKSHTLSVGGLIISVIVLVACLIALILFL